jgi:hypothetical protein
MSTLVGLPWNGLLWRTFTTFVLVIAFRGFHALGRELSSCTLGPNLRPILFVPVLTTSTLYDSSNNFAIESIDPVDFSPNSPDNNGIGDLDLPLLTGLTQGQTPVGPEGVPDDPLPGLKDPARAGVLNYVVRSLYRMNMQHTCRLKARPFRVTEHVMPNHSMLVATA